MKISTILLPLTVQAEWERPSYRQIYKRIRDNEPLNLSPISNLRADHSLINECGGVAHEKVSNSTVIAAVDNSNGVWCDGNTCTALCLPGYTPVGRWRSRCRVKHTKKKKIAKWTADLRDYKCITCGEDATPTNTDGMNLVNCGLTGVTTKKCTYQCQNQMALVHPTLIGKKLRTTQKALCKCDRRAQTCGWKIGNQMGSPADFACSDTKIVRGNKYDQNLVKQCSHKPARCTEIALDNFSKLNSWECRNCFRIRLKYHMTALGITNFDNRDYLDIQFDQEVKLQNLPHTISATDVGNNVHRITFPSGSFGNGQMDFTATVRALSKEPSLIKASSCPCSVRKGAEVVLTKPVFPVSTTPSPVGSPPIQTCNKKKSADWCTKVHDPKNPVNPVKSLTRLNTYTCRNCFRVRLKYKFQKFDAINSFNFEDFILLKYNAPVKLESFQYPVKGAQHLVNSDGDHFIKVNFAYAAQWANKEMDLTLELRAMTLDDPKVEWVKSCPCFKFTPSQYKVLNY